MNIMELPLWSIGLLATAFGYYAYRSMERREQERITRELANKMAMTAIKADSLAFEMRWEQFFKEAAKEEIKARCLANSTRPRHSRSTLRKTR